MKNTKLSRGSSFRFIQPFNEKEREREGENICLCNKANKYHLMMKSSFRGFFYRIDRKMTLLAGGVWEFSFRLFHFFGFLAFVEISLTCFYVIQDPRCFHG